MVKKVFLGMSGGVDSAVAAYLLKEAGYEVVGVYMKNWSRDLPGMKCPWAEDLADAKRVAVQLDLDFRVFDFEREYKQKVVDYMLAEYRKGNTPNPDIMCNQEIKFRLFVDTALEAGADLIATGHYAIIRDTYGFSASSSYDDFSIQNESGLKNGIGLGRIGGAEAGGGRKALCMARDKNKDQTYFLYRVDEEVLGRVLFPVGGMLKAEVKRMALGLGLAVAGKAESMGVCFVGEANIRDFLAQYVEQVPGEIREVETDKVLGVHDGAIYYTLGQRHGLHLTMGLPYYVVRKDMDKNIVYVSQNLNNRELWCERVKLKDVVLREKFGGGKVRVEVRVRHRAKLAAGWYDVGAGILEFDEAQRALAAGQSMVFYRGDICVGGGILCG